VAPARRCAFVVLRRVFEHGAYADRALRGEAAGLDARDRALAMRLTYGTVQRRGTLDHVIERLAQRPTARLQSAVLGALRLGMYELLYLDGSPDHAVVADAVELAKADGGSGHGLVNAVLRRATREGADALLGELTDDTPEHAAVKHSHPEWIARMWWSQLGAEQARLLLASGNEPAETALRANTLVTEGAALVAGLPVAARLDDTIPEAVVLQDRFDAYSSPLWREGAFVAQSRAAMLVARALDPRPGERVLDVCAAPGAKTTHLAALMGGVGEVVAVERNARRAEQIARAARRCRADNVRVEVRDAALARADATFDRVLVDPPCSGLGTLQSHPDLRWRMSPDAVAELVRAQRDILTASAAALRPGGVLVYSTCTISPTENERLIAAFLDSHPDFGIDDLLVDLPSFGPASGSCAVSRRSILTLPHRDHTAGFFIARLRRS
jgi:16S rRNA (cytosine967-C5)-methyltransferase